MSDQVQDLMEDVTESLQEYADDPLLRNGLLDCFCGKADGMLQKYLATDTPVHYLDDDELASLLYAVYILDRDTYRDKFCEVIIPENRMPMTYAVMRHIEEEDGE